MKNNILFYASLLALVTGAHTGLAQQGVITTIAGNGTMGYSGDGGSATAAALKYPFGEVADKNGNIYICDYSNNRVRKVTPSGIITTFAGNGSWGLTTTVVPATAATITPDAIAIDTAGNFYIADSRYHCLYKIDAALNIHLLAGNGTWGYSGDGGPASAAELYMPDGVAVDKKGNIYICDNGNDRIRMINTTGTINTIAGNGVAGFGGDGGAATAAKLNSPTGITLDASGNLYIADGSNNRIRLVTTNGLISTIVGNGTAGFAGDGGAAVSAELNNPISVLSDLSGDLYIADQYNARVRKVNTEGTISTYAGKGVTGFAGDGGPADSALFNDICGMATAPNGVVYIADEANDRIRKVFNNFIPYFTKGAMQNISLCENAAPVQIDTLLAVVDSDAYQTETWTVIGAPAHGIVLSSYAAPSNQGKVVPEGMTYAANNGFSGADTIVMQVTDGFGADTMTIYAKVITNPALAQIYGHDTTCIGIRDSLTNNAPGGTWQLAGTGVVTLSAAGVVTGLATGNARILYTDTNTCGAGTVSYTVTVDPLPNFGTITGHTALCAGTADTLSATVAGGLWSTTNPGIATVSTGGVVTAIAAGPDTVTYGNTTVCGVFASELVINVLPLPDAGTIAGHDSLCVGLTDSSPTV